VSWIPVGVYPVEERGGDDGFGINVNPVRKGGALNPTLNKE